ncbi:hypothetical protein ACTFIZ_002344 [Dictyostelium cf. discoideum]
MVFENGFKNLIESALSKREPLNSMIKLYNCKLKSFKEGTIVKTITMVPFENQEATGLIVALRAIISACTLIDSVIHFGYTRAFCAIHLPGHYRGTSDAPSQRLSFKKNEILSSNKSKLFLFTIIIIIYLLL